jgi:5-methylcytosine-specific restriction enzyme A
MEELRFERGRIYNRRQEIHGPFGGQRQGGISTPKAVPAVFVFTGETGEQYGYRDGPDDRGVFLYTGEGQLGDMEFVRGNQAIRDHALRGRTLHLFEAQGKGKGYRYLGEYVCANYEFRTGPDREGSNRKIIVFHLLPADGTTSIPETDPDDLPVEPLPRTLDEARRRAYEAVTAVEGSAGKEALRTYYRRNRAVRDYVLMRAGDKCESCNRPAPFFRKDESPYLEPHHTTRLSDAGLDHPKFVAAICPACHREIHYGRDGQKKNSKLVEYLTKVETQ